MGWWRVTFSGRSVATATATMGGKTAQVTYAGSSPGQLSGIMQVEIVVPSGAGTGAVPVVRRPSDRPAAKPPRRFTCNKASVLNSPAWYVSLRHGRIRPSPAASSRSLAGAQRACRLRHGSGGLPRAAAGSKTAGAPHTAWQLLEHMRTAQWDILGFSRDAKHKSPSWPEGYWPKTEAPPERRGLE